MLTGYFSTEAQLHAVNKAASLKYYFDNGMWELIMSEARAEHGVIYGVNLKMKRKPYFVIIIPVMLLSLMSFMVFLLPPESGERMSYSVTLLLISETIPKKSSPLPLPLYCCDACNNSESPAVFQRRQIFCASMALLLLQKT